MLRMLRLPDVHNDESVCAPESNASAQTHEKEPAGGSMQKTDLSQRWPILDKA